jgi:hypothetical protein
MMAAKALSCLPLIEDERNAKLDYWRWQVGVKLQQYRLSKARLGITVLYCF